jgi:hypothetical protein
MAHKTDFTPLYWLGAALVGAWALSSGGSKEERRLEGHRGRAQEPYRTEEPPREPVSQMQTRIPGGSERVESEVQRRKPVSSTMGPQRASVEEQARQAAKEMIPAQGEVQSVDPGDETTLIYRYPSEDWLGTPTKTPWGIARSAQMFGITGYIFPDAAGRYPMYAAQVEEGIFYPYYLVSKGKVIPAKSTFEILSLDPSKAEGKVYLFSPDNPKDVPGRKAVLQGGRVKMEQE